MTYETEQDFDERKDDFIDNNKTDLINEFVDKNKIDFENFLKNEIIDNIYTVEFWKTVFCEDNDDYNDYVNDSYNEFVDIDNTERSLINERL